MSATVQPDARLIGPPCSINFDEWLTAAPRDPGVVARARQRIRRAQWIRAEGLSAYEAAHIPLNFDPLELL